MSTQGGDSREGAGSVISGMSVNSLCDGSEVDWANVNFSQQGSEVNSQAQQSSLSQQIPMRAQLKRMGGKHGLNDDDDDDDDFIEERPVSDVSGAVDKENESPQTPLRLSQSAAHGRAVSSSSPLSNLSAQQPPLSRGGGGRGGRGAAATAVAAARGRVSAGMRALSGGDAAAMLPPLPVTDRGGGGAGRGSRGGAGRGIARRGRGRGGRGSGGGGGGRGSGQGYSPGNEEDMITQDDSASQVGEGAAAAEDGEFGGEQRRNKTIAEKVTEAFTGVGFQFPTAVYVFRDNRYSLNLRQNEFNVNLDSVSANNDEKVMTYVNQTVMDPWDIVPNKGSFMVTSPERVAKSNRMFRNWTTVSHATVDCFFPQLQTTAPLFQVVKVSHSMAMPDDVRKLLFVVNAVNNAPNFNRFALPTERTRLETEGTRIVKYIAHETSDPITGRSVIEHSLDMMELDDDDDAEGGGHGASAEDGSSRSDRISLTSPKTCSFQKPTYEQTFVKNRPVQFFVALYPVTYKANGEDCKAVAWTATAVPLPGFNFLHAVRNLYDSWSSASRMNPDLYTAHTRSVCAVWQQLVLSACYDGKLDVPIDVSAGVTDAYNINDAHEARIMSPFTFHRKVLNQVYMYEGETKVVTELEVIGHACVETQEHMSAMDQQWEDKYTVDQAWYKTFDTAMRKSNDFGSFNRALIPSIVFPPVLKLSVRGEREDGNPGDIDGPEIPHFYQSLLGEAPLVICSNGGAAADSDRWLTDYNGMKPLMLPPTVDAAIAEWFFGIDQALFLTELDSWNGKGVPPGLRNRNHVLDGVGFLLPGAYSSNRVTMQTYISSIMRGLASAATAGAEEVGVGGNDHDFSTSDSVSPFAEPVLAAAAETRAAADVAVVHMQNFLKAAFAKITSDVSDRRFDSDHIEGVFTVMNRFSSTIVPEMRAFRDRFYDREAGSLSRGVVPGVSYVLDGALTHQGGCIELNKFMDQNAPNLTIYRELYTCNGSMMGTHAQSWQSYYWTMWVCILNGLVTTATTTGPRDTFDSNLLEKPNSAGLDTAVILNKHKTVMLAFAMQNDSSVKGLTDYTMTSATPYAIQTMTVVAVTGQQVVPQFNREIHLQCIHMTEFRPADFERTLDTIVRELPRDQTMNARPGFTTDKNDKGQREMKNLYPVQRLMLTVIATNKKIRTRSGKEAGDSMRASVAFEAAGRARCLRSTVHASRTMEDALTVRGKKSMEFPTSPEKRQLFRAGMSLSEIMSKAVFAMHWSGFVAIEVPHEVKALYEWYIFVFNQSFRWLLPSNEATSTFERVVFGWRARGVADTVFHSVIGRFAGAAAAAELHPEAAGDNPFMDAVIETLIALHHGAHAMHTVPVQFHLALKHMIDPRPILVNHVFAEELHPPVVSLTWLRQLCKAGVTSQNGEALLQDPDYLAVRAWIMSLCTRRLFLPHTTTSNMDLTNNVTPYVSSAGNAVGGGVCETLLRTRMEDIHDPAHVWGKEVAGSTLAKDVFSGTGVPHDEHVWRSAFKAYRELSINTTASFGGFDIFNVRDVFHLFQITHVPPRFNKRVADGGREWGKEVAKQMQFGTEEKYVVTGVHFMALLLLTSVYQRDAEPGFHSNMVSNAAGNVVRFCQSLAPPIVPMGGHRAQHIKTFRFAASDTPKGSVLTGIENQDVDYFMRPAGDTEPFMTEKLSMLGSMLNNYMFEDTVHMAQLLSFMRWNGVRGRHLLSVPVWRLCPEYELVPGRSYPFVRVLGERLVAGSLTIAEEQSDAVSLHGGYVDSGSGEIEIPDADDEGVDSARPPPEIEAVHCSCLPHSLGVQGIIVMPLIQRRNAVVYSASKGFGVVMPSRSSLGASGLPQCFDPMRCGYKVKWAGGVNHVNFMHIDRMLQRVGSYVCVRFESTVFDSIRPRLVVRAGSGERPFVRGNIFYPHCVQRQSREEQGMVYVLFDFLVVRVADERSHTRETFIRPVPVQDLVPASGVAEGDMFAQIWCHPTVAASHGQ